MSLDDLFKISLNAARSKRGDAFYDHAGVTSDAEFEEIFEEAKKFVSFVKSKIKKEFPDLGISL